MTLAPRVTLSDGTTMPVLGLGTWAARDEEVYEAVKTAIDIGYRHFDTAWLYQNEQPVGRAIREKISEGKVTREEIYVTTKLWPTFFARDQVVPMCRESLKNLGLTYIDQYLVHWPFGMRYTQRTDDFSENLVADETHDFIEAYKGIEECHKLGLVRSIGISNFTAAQTERVLAVAEVKPVVNQVECSIQVNQKELYAFSKERGILLTAYCPLARPDPAKQEPDWFYSEELGKIAEKYGKTRAQVSLRYLIDIGTVPLPKSSNPKRLKENFDLWDFKLSKEDIAVLEKFNRDERINVPFEAMKHHKDYCF